MEQEGDRSVVNRGQENLGESPKVTESGTFPHCRDSMVRTQEWGIRTRTQDSQGYH